MELEVPLQYTGETINLCLELKWGLSEKIPIIGPMCREIFGVRGVDENAWGGGTWAAPGIK